MSRNRKSAVTVAGTLLTVALVMILQSISSEAVAQTGSRLSQRSIAVGTYWMNGASEINEVRNLLQNERPDQAVKVAQEFVYHVKRSSSWGSIGRTRVLYDALNALCVALTVKGDADEAVDVCNEAIRLQPNDWRAVNSRGTAYFTLGNYRAAMEDYRRALATEPSSDQVVDLLRRNLRLAESGAQG